MLSPLLKFPILFLLFFLATPIQASGLSVHGPLVYDRGLNVTWLRDANFAKTTGFDQTTSITDGSGFMTTGDARRFINELNNRRHLGGSRWRLPTIGELAHLYHNDGVRHIVRDPSAAQPFSNLGAMYWAQDERSFDFGAGREISSVNYRHVLPVHSGRLFAYMRPNQLQPYRPIPIQPVPRPYLPYRR